MMWLEQSLGRVTFSSLPDQQSNFEDDFWNFVTTTKCDFHSRPEARAESKQPRLGSEEGEGL